MASGRTLLEHEEGQKPPGFFPKLYENLVSEAMSRRSEKTRF